MSNSNLKYRNGLAKRAAVRAAAAELRSAGAFQTRSLEYATARFGGRPGFILDTNLMFVVIEYWGDALRAELRELLHAQPTLRLHLLDVVSSECRGQAEARRRIWEEIVYDGRNGDRALLYALRSDTRAIEMLTSELRVTFPPARPSDSKDAIIAAAAIGYDLGVVTRNTADFERYRVLHPELRVYGIDGRNEELAMNADLLRLLASGYTDPAERAKQR